MKLFMRVCLRVYTRLPRPLTTRPSRQGKLKNLEVFFSIYFLLRCEVGSVAQFSSEQVFFSPSPIKVFFLHRRGGGGGGSDGRSHESEGKVEGEEYKGHQRGEKGLFLRNKICPWPLGNLATLSYSSPFPLCTFQQIYNSCWNSCSSNCCMGVALMNMTIVTAIVSWCCNYLNM